MRVSSEKLNDRLEMLRTEFYLVAQVMNCAVWEYNVETKCLKHLRKLDGKYSEQNMDIDNFRETCKGWGIVHPDDLAMFDAYCDSMDSGDEDYQYDLRAMTDNDTFIILRYMGTSILDESGKPLYSIGVTLDVSGEKKQADDWKEMVSRDSLTGVYNKGGFKNIVTDRMLFADDDERSALMVIDIDDFKYFNDTFGHLFGDNVLTAFADELVELFRENGVVGRVGGDEFAVYFADYVNISEVQEAALTLVESIRNITLSKSCSITTSVGIALYPRDAINYNELFEKADIALYNVKLNGKNNFAIYEEKFADIPAAERCLIERKESERIINPAIEDHMTDSSLIDTVLGILEKADGDISVVDGILSAIGRYYELSRIYLCRTHEFSEDFEAIAVWADEEHHISALNLEKELTRKLPEIIQRSGRDSIFCCENTYRIEFNPKYWLCCEDALSFVQCYLYNSNKLEAFITFEDCYGPRDWEEHTLNTLSSIAKIISIYSYYLKDGVKFGGFSDNKFADAIVNGQNFLSYAIKTSDYELVYANEFAKYLNSNPYRKEKCYRYFFNKNAPCAHCPVKYLNESVDTYTVEYFDRKQCSWTSTTATKAGNFNRDDITVLTVEDITQQVSRIKAVDTITGLMTSERFASEMERILSENSGKGYYLFDFAVDDYFKIRSEIGVRVLSEGSRRFSEFISTSIGPDELLCRWEQGSFMMLLQSESIEAVRIRFELILRSAGGMIFGDYHLQLTFTYGLYILSEKDSSAVYCMECAEIAKKDMQAKGRYDEFMNYTIFTDELKIKHNQDLYYQTHIAEAFEKDQLLTFLQPMVDAKTNEVCAVEALVRWVNEKGKLILPNIFLPIFEDSEIAAKIDLYMCKRVFRIINRWLNEDKEVLPISINISKSSIMFADFACELDILAKRYKVPAGLIKIELTERIFNDDLDRVIGMLLKLSELGYSISIDNYSNHYPLMNIIKVLPVSEIKLSGEFFNYDEISAESKAQIKSIVSEAHKSKLRVVAVEVRNEKQAEYLKSVGCDVLQGYAYFEPVSVADFDSLVR